MNKTHEWTIINPSATRSQTYPSMSKLSVVATVTVTKLTPINSTKIRTYYEQ